MLLISLALGACGRRTVPVPVGALLPVPGGLAAWQRESQALVSWRVLGEEVTGSQGGLEGFVLAIDRDVEFFRSLLVAKKALSKSVE